MAPQACGALAKSHVVNHKDGVALRRKWASGIRTTVARHRFSDLAAFGSSVHRTHRTPARRVPSMQSITPGSAFSCTQLCSRGLFMVRSRVWFMLRPSLERSRQRRNRWCLLLLIYGCNKPCDYQSDEQLAPWHRRGREVARGFARCTVKWQVVQAESEKPWVRASSGSGRGETGGDALVVGEVLRTLGKIGLNWEVGNKGGGGLQVTFLANHSCQTKSPTTAFATSAGPPGIAGPSQLRIVCLYIFHISEEEQFKQWSYRYDHQICWKATARTFFF